LASHFCLKWNQMKPVKRTYAWINISGRVLNKRKPLLVYWLRNDVLYDILYFALWGLSVKLWTSFLSGFIYVYRKVVHLSITMLVLFLYIFIFRRKPTKECCFSLNCLKFSNKEY
jgi:hypothetical protein